MKFALLLAATFATACASPSMHTDDLPIDVTAPDGVHEQMRESVGREVCLVGILYVDSAPGSHYDLPDTHPGVIALYADRVVVPLRAVDALEMGLRIGANHHTMCGVLIEDNPDQNSYRLAPRR